MHAVEASQVQSLKMGIYDEELDGEKIVHLEPESQTASIEFPMLFDSFYVSMLSEKYKVGKSSLINAFYRGLLSNVKAGRNGEYSSVIYLIKKAK